MLAAERPDRVSRLVLVAPSLSDPAVLRYLAKMPVQLFWARDDPVKAFSLSSMYIDAVEELSFQTVASGGHRVLDQYVHAMRAFLTEPPRGSVQAAFDFLAHRSAPLASYHSPPYPSSAPADGTTPSAADSELTMDVAVDALVVHGSSMVEVRVVKSEAANDAIFGCSCRDRRFAAELLQPPRNWYCRCLRLRPTSFSIVSTARAAGV